MRKPCALSVFAVLASLGSSTVSVRAVDFNLRDPGVIGEEGASSIEITVDGLTATVTASSGILRLTEAGFGVQMLEDTNPLLNIGESITIRFNADVTWNSVTISAQDGGNCGSVQFNNVMAPGAFLCGSDTFTTGAGIPIPAQTGVAVILAVDTTGMSVDGFSVTPVTPPMPPPPPPQPDTLRLLFPNFTASESIGNLRAAVQRQGARSSRVTVDYVTRALTATANIDYTAVAGTLVFEEGVGSQIINVPIADDSDGEAAEQFEIEIMNASSGATIDTPSVAIVTIDPSDVPSGVLVFDPALGTGLGSFRELEIRETDGSVSLRILRQDGAFGRVTVWCTAESRSATRDVDFGRVSQSIVFEDGQTEATVTVPIVDDADPEPNESFDVRIQNPTDGAVLGEFLSDTVEVTILDNDTPIRLDIGQDPRFTTLRASESIRNMQVSVEAVGNDFMLATLGTITVICRTRDLTARNGIDYTAGEYTLTFPNTPANNETPNVFYNGEHLATATIPIMDNELLEPSRSFVFEVLSVQTEQGSIELPLTSLEMTIEDNELPQGRLRFVSSSLSGNALTDRVANIIIERYGGAEGQITVDYATNLRDDDSAIEGFHFIPASGTLVFGPGVTSQSFVVQLGNDPTQGTSTVGVLLSNVTGGAELTTPFGTLQIVHRGDFFSSAFAILCGPGLLAPLSVSIACLALCRARPRWRRRATRPHAGPHAP